MCGDVNVDVAACLAVCGFTADVHAVNIVFSAPLPIVENRRWLLGDELNGDDQARGEQAVCRERGHVEV